ncbi:MAG TPA: hypothetical protein VF832_07755 [Longimicrobiales bacterium]
MTRQLRELERVESRVLGALRFVDAGTGTDVLTPLTLRALDGHARFVRNRSGLQVIAQWSSLSAHEASFQNPPADPIGNLTLHVVVTDTTGRYLPRRVAIPLPRDPDATHATQPGSLFQPLRVPLYPAAVAETGANWAVVHAAVTEQATGDALGGALLRVRRNGDVIGRGLTDGRGQALVALVGVPMLTFGQADEAVLVGEITVTVEAVFDPATGTRVPAAQLAAGVRPPVPEVDPDALDANGALPHAQQSVAVAARRSQSLELSISLP